MTNTTHTKDRTNSCAGLADFLARSWEWNTTMTQAFLENLKTGGDMHHMRRTWFNALARSLDAHLRSPEFLETLKRQFQLLTEGKTNGESLGREFAQEMGWLHRSDMNSLFERICQSHERILARLEAIEARLSRLESTKP